MSRVKNEAHLAMTATELRHYIETVKALSPWAQRVAFTWATRFLAYERDGERARSTRRAKRARRPRLRLVVDNDKRGDGK